MHQAQNWTEQQLAYLAGIIDGEGCFCLHDYGTHRYASQLHIGNTDVRLMAWLKEHFGGNVFPERRSSQRHKSIWRWYAAAKELDIIIPAVLPFLLLKRQQAELFLAYRATVARTVNVSHSTADTPEAIKQERRRIHSELRALNKRGVA